MEWYSDSKQSQRKKPNLAPEPIISSRVQSGDVTMLLLDISTFRMCIWSLCMLFLCKIAVDLDLLESHWKLSDVQE